MVKVNNGDILKIMQVIANHTNLKLDEVCHKGMTGIWTKILNDAITKKVSLVGFDNIPIALRKLYSYNQSYVEYQESKDSVDTDLEWKEEEEDEYEGDDEQKDELNQHSEQTVSDYYGYTPRQQKYHAKQGYLKYKGAIVLEPARGLHRDVYLFDVTSLYPTMIIKYNLSPETVNCSCCKNEPKAKEKLTSEILKDCSHIPAKDEGCYWICLRRRGLFAKILQDLTERAYQIQKCGFRS